MFPSVASRLRRRGRNTRRGTKHLQAAEIEFHFSAVLVMTLSHLSAIYVTRLAATGNTIALLIYLINHNILLNLRSIQHYEEGCTKQSSKLMP
jgi:hypothetical protein